MGINLRRFGAAKPRQGRYWHLEQVILLCTRAQGSLKFQHKRALISLQASQKAYNVLIFIAYRFWTENRHSNNDA